MTDQLSMFDLPAANEPVAAPAAAPETTTRRRRLVHPTSMFDLDDSPLGWPCVSCGATTSRPGRCSTCQANERAAAEAREHSMWRIELARRIELGEDVYYETLAESGVAGWTPPHDERVEAITARGLYNGLPGHYRLLLPEALDDHNTRCLRQLQRRRRYVEAPDGRLAPLGWQCGGIAEEVPVVDAGEHFVFEGDVDWLDDGWIDENDARPRGIWGVRYVRPVETVPVGDRL